MYLCPVKFAYILRIFFVVVKNLHWPDEGAGFARTGLGDPEGVPPTQHSGDGGGLDGRGLGELALADSRHQRLVKTKMSEA